MQAIKDTIFFVAIFTVILCLLAFVPIDVLLNGILVMGFLGFCGMVYVQGKQDAKLEKARAEFYKNLCE